MLLLCCIEGGKPVVVALTGARHPYWMDSEIGHCIGLVEFKGFVASMAPTPVNLKGLVTFVVPSPILGMTCWRILDFGKWSRNGIRIPPRLSYAAFVKPGPFATFPGPTSAGERPQTDQN